MQKIWCVTPPPIGSWPETHRLGTTVLDTLGSGHTRTKHTSYWTTNRVRYCCVRKHTSTKNSTKANVTIQEKTWTDCQGRPQVSYSSECQGSRHVKTLLLAPGLGDCTKCALQIAPDNRTQLADSRAQEKIKSTAPKAGRGRGASSRTVGSEPSGQKWSICLAKRHQDREEMLESSSVESACLRGVEVDAKINMCFTVPFWRLKTRTLKRQVSSRNFLSVETSHV